MAGYDAFAPFYDAVQGDRAEHAAYLRSLIGRHHPEARTVLELACGTGSILAQLRDGYELAGVDSSEAMLARAAAKVPEAQLVLGDMRTVQLDERFDVVLCVYDSVNHLLRFEEWEAVFDRAREHLSPSGIFVFDINTERQLAQFAAAAQPWVQRFDGENLLLIDVQSVGGGLYDWQIDVFEHVGDDEFRLHRETIREAAFPAERVLASVRARFARVRAYDAQRARPTPRTERLHVVCHARRRPA